MTDLDHRAEAIRLLNLADGSEHAATLVQAAQVHALLRAGDMQERMLLVADNAVQHEAALQELQAVRQQLADAMAAPAPRRRLTELEHGAAWRAIEGTAAEDGADPGAVLNAVLRALNIDPPARDCPACEVGIEHTAHCPTPESHNWGCGCPTNKRPAEEQRTILAGELSVPLARALRARGHTAAADEIVYILLEDVLAAEGAGA